MRYFLYFISVILNIVLQSTLFEHITLAGIKPNLILVSIVSIACLRDETEGAVYGFFAGFLQDSFFSGYIGSYVFLYTFIGYFCGLLLKSFYRENFILPMGIAAAATFAVNFAYYAMNVLLRGYANAVYFIGRIILPETVYNALLMLIVYNLYLYINKYLEEEEKYKRKVF